VRGAQTDVGAVVSTLDDVFSIPNRFVMAESRAMDVGTQTIDIPTTDGTADAYLVAPTTGGPHPGVLMYMDAYGLRPRLLQMAARLASAGYVVLAPNVFYRAGRAPLIDSSRLRDPEHKAKVWLTLGRLLKGLTPDLSRQDAVAYTTRLVTDPGVAPGAIGVVGYCMGGPLAFRTAADHPDKVAAIATFHGGNLASEAPDSPHLLVDEIKAEVYVAHSDNDASIPPEQQERLEAALTRAGVSHLCELYEGAAHGFTMADTAAYDEAATERHWRNLVGLFDRTLR
jgi:carboxymethylenebutenolidase